MVLASNSGSNTVSVSVIDPTTDALMGSPLAVGTTPDAAIFSTP